MSTRAIRTSTAQMACDVCGRTLLRGERAEVYLSGADRRSVCELCTSRALHGGWVREGTVPEYDGSSDRIDRRRSLLHRLRAGRRDPAPATNGDAAYDGYEDEDGYEDDVELAAEWQDPPTPTPAPPAPPPRSERRGQSRRRRRMPAPPRDRAPATDPGPVQPREPRHVRAVPTSIEHKMASAVSLFNDSEHPRTVAGIARSLGLPDVTVLASDPAVSVVGIVVAWELCWYRYEVELSDEVPSVRVGSQGYELSELSPEELASNASASDRGKLDLSV